MASNINPFNIDGSYPVAGQDNDSQGFRDNFTSIRNNLAAAKTEIEDLQTKAVLKSALTGSTLDNDLAGRQLVRPQLRGYSESFYDHSRTSGTISVNFANANFQKVQTNGSINLAFSGWPESGQYGRVVLWINIESVAHKLTLPTSVSKGLNNIAGATSAGVVTFDEPGDYVFAFSTTDSGTNILIEDVTRNSKKYQDPSFYFNSTVGNTFMVGFGSHLTSSAFAIENEKNVISARGSINALTVGNLYLGTINNRTVDTGKLGGYSITAARGNLAESTTVGVKSNDLLGYLNSVSYTGKDNTSNVYQQTASIGFYATGSNLTYGLGGNIAFFTAPDGQNNVSSVRQAVGIENDTGTRVFGNLFLSDSITASSSSYYPPNSTSSGLPGQIAWRKSGSNYYLYICYAQNSWVRISMTDTSF